MALRYTNIVLTILCTGHQLSGCSWQFLSPYLFQMKISFGVDFFSMRHFYDFLHVFIFSYQMKTKKKIPRRVGYEPYNFRSIIDLSHTLQELWVKLKKTFVFLMKIGKTKLKNNFSFSFVVKTWWNSFVVFYF